MGCAVLQVRLLEPLSTSELVQRLRFPPRPEGGEEGAEPPAGGGSDAGPPAAGAPGTAGGPLAPVDLVAPSPAPDGSVFVGCSASGVIARLQPAPAEEQVRQLT